MYRYFLIRGSLPSELTHFLIRGSISSELQADLAKLLQHSPIQNVVYLPWLLEYLNDCLDEARRIEERTEQKMKRSLAVIQKHQAYELFHPQSKASFNNSWLDKLSMIANDSKHLRLTPTDASNHLRARTTGLVPAREVHVKIQCLDALPQLYQWTLWSRLPASKLAWPLEDVVDLCRRAYRFWYE